MLPASYLFAFLLSILACHARALNKARSLIPRAGSLQQITNFGSNPSNVGMYIYEPNKLAAKPGIIVAIHMCTGSAQSYYNGSPYAKLAEKHGFIVIYPDSPYSGKCWDVSSQASLTHNGGGNSNSIANMVTWAITKYNADAGKVFVTGTSSGAMMTNVLSATYPNLFAAAVAYAGVPAGCFVSASNQADAWNSTCAQGKSISSPEHWASVAKAMNPGYGGSRPKMQIYQGSADTTLNPQNWKETCKQWAGVFGYNYDAPPSKQANAPEANYETTVWGPNVQGVFATGVSHNFPIHGEQDMKWFGFV
ncbi:alpha/beta-hydrolase [Aspergillus coremiiformis]|uniref:Carboxylic ester hydrolase n=1 Tax=Aspergillus coremiiformis TaxID=138285 RepID=A0A5N6Z9I3_9EURO|nr:alpha/beta-hydrolase [Aspergillus coremiiformis]